MIEAKSLANLLGYDQQALKWKIGIVSLSTDLSLENDFYAMRPTKDMGFFVNRVEFINPTTHDTWWQCNLV